MRTLEQQIALLDKIREASRGHLEMEAWHSECGTNHCLAGWAEVLNEEPTEIKDTEELGKFLLPDFAKFFYDMGAGKHLEKYLEARAYTLAEGEVARYQDCWIDRNCNFYSGELSEESARADSLTNKNCKYCTNCTECTECTGCMGCTRCTGCRDCTGCKGCIECTNCIGCTECKYCTYCEYCTGCTGCKYCTNCEYCKKWEYEFN